ncbi:RNA polymerase sigma factor [Sphingobacterium sp. Mn56C]|uniref:RNA polymerase sigma factor n=1 Tax=Sphingobacterium sp. Mn56C TaxID=3395261 RepID=UPI003BC7A0D9
MNVLDELIRGNEKAFEEVFESYHTPLYNFILEKTKSHDMAKEVVQITFIKLWHNRETLKADVSLSKQLFRMAKNAFIDEYRRNQRHNMLDITTVQQELFNNDVLDAVQLKDTQQRLNQLIAAMPPMRQHVFYMSRVLQFSHKEISHILSLSSKTVENHISLAIRHLRMFF